MQAKRRSDQAQEWESVDIRQLIQRYNTFWRDGQGMENGQAQKRAIARKHTHSQQRCNGGELAARKWGRC